MLMTPVTTKPSWVNLVEIFANLGLVGLQAGGVVPVGTSALATALEQTIAPLLSGRANTTQEILAGFGAANAALNLIKGKVKDPQLLSNIQSQITAVGDASATFLASETGTPDLATLAVPIPTV